MKCKNGHNKKRRHLPYGATRGKYWCFGCDADLVSSWDKPIKKKERQHSKKEIAKLKYE